LNGKTLTSPTMLTPLEQMRLCIQMKRTERIAIIKAEQKRRKEAKRRLKAGLTVGFAQVFPAGVARHISSFLKVPISAVSNTQAAGLVEKYRRLGNQIALADLSPAERRRRLGKY
jgi:chorismate mutase